MPEKEREKRDTHGRERFTGAVGKKASRKITARAKAGEGIWFWLGMMGLVGWSVSVPTLAGVFLGQWIDRRWPSDVSWTLMLLLAGVVVGCIQAWYWITRESKGE